MRTLKDHIYDLDQARMAALKACHERRNQNLTKEDKLVLFEAASQLELLLLVFERLSYLNCDPGYRYD